MKTYKFRLYPTKEQMNTINETTHLCRRLYNALLEQRIFAYKHRGTSIDYYTQKKELPLLKKECPEYKSVHSQVLQDVVKRLDKAYQGFFRRLKNGEKAGFPRFKGANRYSSFTYTQSGFDLSDDYKFIKLSKIGNVRIKCHRRPEGRVKTCSVIEKNGRYYVCLSCEVQKEKVTQPKHSVGIDLGIKHLAITSDGVFFEMPTFLRQAEKHITRLQKDLSRKKKGSNRRRKAKLRLAKAHEKVFNQRRDYAHKVSRILADTYKMIAFEDLNVQGMVKNRRLSKSITDAAWHQLVTFTTYKAENAGGSVVSVNPYNTSQECSNCGNIVKKALSVRTHKCPCGYMDDRDVNAAKNILKRAQLKNAS